MTASSPSQSPDAAASNFVIVRGKVTRQPTRRDLAGGSMILQFDLSTQVRNERNAALASNSIPVVWIDPTEAQERSVEPDADLVVVGTVRRRFFRSGGATQSRTEVVVDRAIPAHHRKTVRSVVAAAMSDVNRAVEQPGPSAASG